MIEIEASPFLFQFGTFALSWHGLFSFIGVAAAVFLVGRWAILRNIDPDDIYSIAVWGIVGGIIGARLVCCSEAAVQVMNGARCFIWSRTLLLRYTPYSSDRSSSALVYMVP